MEHNPRLEAALKYARMGFRVHPLRAKSKLPALKGWQDLATTDEMIIKEWWEKDPRDNPGVLLSPAQQVLVVDVDTKNGGDKTLEYLQQYLLFPPTMTVQTPSGGLHLYYRYPRRQVLPKDQIGFAPGIDLLINRNVVAAGAETEAGTYLFTDGGDREPAFAPGWLTDLLEDPESRGRLEQVVREGGRNNELNRHGFRLKHVHGLDDDGVKAGMLFAGLNSCEPPYPSTPQEQEEMDKTLRSVLESEASTREDRPHEQDTLRHVLEHQTLDDEGNFYRLLKVSGNNLRFWRDGSNAIWYHWNGSFWEKTDRSIIQHYTTQINHELISLARARLRIARFEEREDQAAEDLLSWGYAMRNKSMIDRLIRYAEDAVEVAIDANAFDQNDYLIGAGAWVLRLADGKVEAIPPDPSLMISKQLGTDYDWDAKCPQWEQFVLDIMSGDQDMVRYLQRAVGYSLTGSTIEQVLFLFQGGGANGKSVFLRVIKALMGDYGDVTSFTTFDDDKRSNQIPADLAALQGVRFVYATEREDERNLAEGRVKMITGGDEISARHLYGDFFSFKPKFKVFLAVNTLPRILGDDDGIWRRIQVVDFRESYLGREDKHLADKLMTELPGILNWALEGLEDWHRQGLAPPARVKALTATYRTDQDILGLFLRDNVELNDEALTNSDMWVPAGELYDLYVAWCKENGHGTYSQTRLTRRLKERWASRGEVTTRFRGVTHFTGISLLKTVDDYRRARDFAIGIL